MNHRRFAVMFWAFSVCAVVRSQDPPAQQTLEESLQESAQQFQEAWRSEDEDAMRQIVERAATNQ